MKNKRIRALTIVLGAVVILFAAYGIYSRPMTLIQLYPELERERCTEIHANCEQYGAVRNKRTADPGSEAFEQLCDLIYSQKYRRRLKSFFPESTRVHGLREGDFEWEIILMFDAVAFADGYTGSGALLRIRNWYGELEVESNGRRNFCKTKEMNAWLKQVLEAIQ